jgi:hypothetical protein
MLATMWNGVDDLPEFSTAMLHFTNLVANGPFNVCREGIDAVAAVWDAYGMNGLWGTGFTDWRINGLAC